MACARDGRQPAKQISPGGFPLDGQRVFLFRHIHAGDRTAERQVAVADRVITALNDFARLPVPQLEPVDIQACLKDILEVTTLPGNINVQWHLGTPPPIVLGDRAQLHIVFSNLIRNARDAMPNGGTLTLLGGYNTENVEVSVRDTGAGIPHDNLPRIFEPLYSTKAKGIGLGLSIAYEILGRHRGTLHVKSDVGVGTSFTVRLPRAS